MVQNSQIIREQLQQLRDRESLLFNQKAQIKKWCITLWTVALFFSISKENCPGILNSIRIILPIVLLFWAIEGMYSAMLILNAKHQIVLEKKLAMKEYSIDKVTEIFLVSNNTSIPLTDKLIAFIKAFFLTETITLFYLSIIFITILTLKTIR